MRRVSCWGPGEPQWSTRNHFFRLWRSAGCLVLWCKMVLIFPKSKHLLNAKLSKSISASSKKFHSYYGQARWDGTVIKCAVTQTGLWSPEPAQNQSSHVQCKNLDLERRLLRMKGGGGQTDFQSWACELLHQWSKYPQPVGSLQMSIWPQVWFLWLVAFSSFF
jgi:hypothetical protein